MYDKAVNRKPKVHFNPRQTLEFLKGDMAQTDLSYEMKRHIVKQYLDVSILSSCDNRSKPVKSIK